MAKLVFDENNLTIGDLEDFEDATGIELQDAIKPVPLKDDENKPVRHDCTEDECDPDNFKNEGDATCQENGRPVLTVKVRPKVLKALVWIANRHENPDFSIEDARNVKVTELEIIREGDGDDAGGVDPKD